METKSDVSGSNLLDPERYEPQELFASNVALHKSLKSQFYIDLAQYTLDSILIERKFLKPPHEATKLVRL